MCQVDSAAFERSLVRLRPMTAGSAAGVFGPGSPMWRVDREAITFLGAGRALLLQLAHPWVAAAVAEHSTALADPLGRFHRTFGTVFPMVFGTVDQAFLAARRLHERHASVVGRLPHAAGRLPAGSLYRANDARALQWVHATLVDTALQAFELVLPPLAAQEREAYYADSRRFAMLFGIPEESLPPDWTAFGAYVAAMLSSDFLVVTPAARQIADRLLGGTVAGARVPRWFRDLTAALMPAPLRRQFSLPFDTAERRRAAQAIDWIRRIHPFLPGSIRYVAPYLEARSRLCGRAAPGVATQLLNTFWIGRRRMIGGD